MARRILILSEFPSTQISRLVTKLKIFIKEGLWHQDWASVYANRASGGSISLPRYVADGLRSCQVSFTENDFSPEKIYDTVFILKDVNCLKWAIRQKRMSRISRIVAGPLLVNEPSQSNRLIESREIDTVVLPSQWIADLFRARSQRKDINYQVWPLGIDPREWRPLAAKLPIDPLITEASPPRKEILIYVKNPANGLLEGVTASLEAGKRKYRILKAGDHTQADYKSLLQTAYAVIFLSRTETQGLAMFESWACDVPTLHWNCGTLDYQGLVYTAASSCPYLTDLCGMDFRGLGDFEAKLASFDARIAGFKPREFILNGHTLEQSVRNLLTL